MTAEHRTYGRTMNCKGCRYWSEMIAMAQRGYVQALCLCRQSPESGNYTHPGQTCLMWTSGHLGPIDEPGNDEVDKYLREADVAADLVPIDSNGHEYVKQGGKPLKLGDKVRLRDRGVVCTLNGGGEDITHLGVTFRIWQGRMPNGAWVPVMEVDTQPGQD